MIPETVFGLPLHILAVHSVVVLVPLAALGTVAVAAVPRLRKPFALVVAGLAVLATINTFVAVIAGQNLERRMEEAGFLGGAAAEQVEAHASMGSALRWYVLALAVVAVALFLLTRRAASRAVLVGIAVVSVVAAALTTVQVIRTGHSGSTAVWEFVYDPGD